MICFIYTVSEFNIHYLTGGWAQKPYKMPNVEEDTKLDFKDVLLRPKRSKIKSRADVSSSDSARSTYK